MKPAEGDVKELLDEVARRAEDLLPRRWRDARLDYHALGSFETGELSCRGSWARSAVPRSGIFELLRDVRRHCHTPEAGTWSSLRLYLDPDEGWAVETDPPDDFPWKDEVTAADCARELAEFPRPRSLVPDWMARPANAQRDADAFDPETVLRHPRPEGGLLGEGNEDYFERARATLADFMPADLERLRIGGLEEGCWSVVPSGTSWLAVRYSGGRCYPVVAFPEARTALVHAAARIMAEAGMSIDCALLRAADVVEKRHNAGADAWALGEAGRRAARLTTQWHRPGEGEAAAEATIALGSLSNKPGGYFVCRPGPVPEEGTYITARKVFELALARALPPVRKRRKVEHPERVRQVRPAPLHVLPAGTYVDAYEHHDQNRVYRIGTPSYRRGLIDRTREGTYHVYRVEKPLQAVPSRLAALPTTSEEEQAERAGTDQGQGYVLGSDIGALLRSGHLSEVTGSDGAPVPEPGRAVTQVRRTYEMSQPGSETPSVRQRPAPFDEERYEELQIRLGRILLEIAPQGWRRIDLRILMIASVWEVALTVLMDDGRHAEVEPPRNFAEIAAELRSMMYRPDEGTWFSMRYMMDPPDAYWASFNTDFDPFWDPPVPAKAWEHDLRVFPRTADHIPGWLRERLEADDQNGTMMERGTW
ncbi:glycohydrolase toxin TNT-related protein [Actinomadura viridis]|uniref:glycohydrolase toxin TNT-related protein n=1 Tax=Actinomadura viridis TaxID=58110 RepID=UPI0036ACE3D2